MSFARYAGSQPRPILTCVSSGRPPLTRDTVWFFWRLTRPLSRLIFPAPGAGAGAGGAAAGAGAGAAPARERSGGAGGAGGALGAAGCGGAGCGGAAWGAAGAGGSSTVTPKSVAMPASPFAYPWPTARTFQAPPLRYTSTTTSAVSVPSRGGVKVARTAPVAASRTVAVGSTPWKVRPASSGLAVTTIRSMSAGTAAVSTVIASGDAPPPDR
ncbi:hypothetical protein BG846_03740 [Streptomyces fradiae ATCC 10745 = DSM 40063]|uniref:Uncharacterized protein n=1 Tax=Streptomyces fradiae ATCC 10745 = DSM 40063 TaxID=1319510 RepID=A0A1Y2NSS2_STRFR|nr:hypothetical protein BG846_03740 [Streptomyces fradiae ATCC 10745 = DSM 40063]